MAEEQKPVEVPQEETAPVTEAPVADKPVEDVVAPTEPTAATDETPAETTEEAKAEDKVEEAQPIEEGQLGYKAQGMSFPKNLIPSKETFFFGTESIEPKSLASYQKSEKSTEAAQHNISWASHTGKGLLFRGDKKAPTGIINLSDAAEPEVDGSHKFHLTSKGIKHTFKASNTAERDNWVSQLKLKIAEAKEMVATVTESEAFKQTLESFKPAPVAKDEPKTEEAPKIEEPAKEEAPVATEEAAAVESSKLEEPVKEEPKRRSASRKRASFFGFGKKEEKKEEAKTEEVPAVDAPAAEPVAETEPITEEAAVVEAPATEDKPVDEVESPKEKPAAPKRNSFFGNVFSKKEKKPAEVKPIEAVETEQPESALATEEAAPALPPVDTATTPLEVSTATPATVPTETVDVTPAEAKKDVKEKRKSSLPFAFGKREKSPAGVESEKTGPFSKFRATIRGRSGKADEKPAEEAAPEVPVKEEDAVVEAPKEPEIAAESAVNEPVVEAEAENKPETVASSTPAVAATA